MSLSEPLPALMPTPDYGDTHPAFANVLKLTPKPERQGRFATLSFDKLRGGYYTPQAVAAWMCCWAIRSKNNTVLEPSCGDGSFVSSVAQRLLSLGASNSAVTSQIHGIELLPGEAEAARARLTAIVGGKSKECVTTADFFEWWSRPSTQKFSVVVGNPPFIRYQSFPEPARSRAMAIMQGLGFRPNKLTNIWVPFVVAATELLKPGGRMALVIPAELLQVTYAGQLRTFLTERFTHIDIVACNELFFEGAEQEVVLLLADGALPERTASNVCRVAMTEAESVTALLSADPIELLSKAENKDVRGDREKWLKYFLSSHEIGLMRDLRAHPSIVDFGALVEVDVGIVTGANEFFVMRKSEAAARGLSKLTYPLVSRSAHMRGARLSPDDWSDLSTGDERVHLLNIRQGKTGRIPSRAATYVAEGEARGVHEGYKCSIRKPWYHVPTVWSPDAFLFRQIHDFPRVVLNEAGATATDTIHRVRSRGTPTAILAAGAFTHLTAASAEIEGRSYGGGVLELEPTEAERLLVPNAEAMAAALPLAECDALIRAGRLAAVLEENDRLVLRGMIGLSEGDCSALRGVWARMQGRRFARGRRSRKKP
jgi:adenine-specific DNA-methyltransferase